MKKASNKNNEDSQSVVSHDIHCRSGTMLPSQGWMTISFWLWKRCSWWIHMITSQGNWSMTSFQQGTPESIFFGFSQLGEILSKKGTCQAGRNLRSGSFFACEVQYVSWSFDEGVDVTIMALPTRRGVTGTSVFADFCLADVQHVNRLYWTGVPCSILPHGGE